MTPLNVIFSWFETGDFPTQEQFQQTFSSFRHKLDLIPYAQVEGLDAKFNLMLPVSQFNTHVTDPSSHAGYLALKDASNLTTANVNAWKSRLNISYAATIDGTGQPGNVFTKDQILEIVNNLNMQDDEIIQLLENLREMLTSDDVNLDELQEVVNYIKENRQDIDELKALVIGETTDDKVKLVDSYPLFGTVETQQELNRELYRLITENTTSAIVQITGSAIIPNPLETSNVIIQARDSITGKRMNVDDYASNTEIQINLLDDMVNPINILIQKVTI